MGDTRGGFGPQRVAIRPRPVTVLLVPVDRAEPADSYASTRKFTTAGASEWRAAHNTEVGHTMKLKSKSGAVLGALIAAALVSASASTLGGLDTATLGAETQVVAGCDPDGIDIAYETAYDETSQAYQVTAVRLLGVDDACIGQLASVTLDDDGTVAGILTDEAEMMVALSTIDAVGTLDDFQMDLFTPVGADLVENIALVIA